jgi:hypothetical protein
MKITSIAVRLISAMAQIRRQVLPPKGTTVTQVLKCPNTDREMRVKSWLLIFLTLTALTACVQGNENPLQQSDSGGPIDSDSSGDSDGPDVSGLEYRNATSGVADVALYAERRLGPVNKGLLSIHHHPVTSSSARLEQQKARPEYIRGVLGPSTIEYDCNTRQFSAAYMGDFLSWMDRSIAMGATPIVSLSYVPSCITQQETAKAPPQDAGLYRQYLEDLLTVLVTDRIAAGKAPLQYFEPWNEPDLPYFFYSEYAGHGFNGSLDEYINTIFIPLARTVASFEARHGIDIRFGSAAIWWGRHVTLGAAVGNGFPELHQQEGLDVSITDPILEMSLLGAELGLEGAEWSLNTEWLDRMVAEADAHGFSLEFMSWHHYAGYPFFGYGPEAEEAASGFLGPAGVLLATRSPTASPDLLAQDAKDFATRYPGRELILSEWRLSAGPDLRNGTYDEAAFVFASHAAMHETQLDVAAYLGEPYGPIALAFRLLESLADQRVHVVSKSDSQPVTLWAEGAVTGQVERVTAVVSQWYSYEEMAQEREALVEFNDLSPGDYLVNLYRIDKGHNANATTVNTEDAGDTPPTERFLLAVKPNEPSYLEIPLSGQAAVFLDMTRLE